MGGFPTISINFRFNLEGLIHSSSAKSVILYSASSKCAFIICVTFRTNSSSKEVYIGVLGALVNTSGFALFLRADRRCYRPGEIIGK